jgi:hypothetical protein
MQRMGRDRGMKYQVENSTMRFSKIYDYLCSMSINVGAGIIGHSMANL